MSETPPPFANYPRNVVAPGTADRLQSLMEGYYGYGPLFLLHVVLSLGIMGLSAAMAGDSGGILVLVGILAVMIVMGFLSYRVNRKVGNGAGWSQAQVVLASVAIALGTVCYGIVGYAVLQSIAANHMKKLGVRSGCLGMRKKAIRERIEELRIAEAGG